MIGPRQRETLSILSQQPQRICKLSRRVGPHGSLFYGWRTVHRCIAAGLAESTYLSNGGHMVSITDKGRSVIASD